MTAKIRFVRRCCCGRSLVSSPELFHAGWFITHRCVVCGSEYSKLLAYSDAICEVPF